jgi:hypothetical protein
MFSPNIGTFLRTHQTQFVAHPPRGGLREDNPQTSLRWLQAFHRYGEFGSTLVGSDLFE